MSAGRLAGMSYCCMVLVLSHLDEMSGAHLHYKRKEEVIEVIQNAVPKHSGRILDCYRVIMTSTSSQSLAVS